MQAKVLEKIQAFVDSRYKGQYELTMVTREGTEAHFKHTNPKFLDRLIFIAIPTDDITTVTYYERQGQFSVDSSVDS